MGCFSGPKVESSQLVAAFDAANSKGFDAYENLITYSEQFDNGSWAKNNYNVTANATTAPDGTLTADKLIAVNPSTFHDLFKTPSLSSGTYTLSIFAKAAEQSFIQLRIDDGVISRLAMFNLSTGSVSSSSNVTSSPITSYPNGWYRCSITVTSAIVNAVFNGFPTSSNVTYSGDGVSGIYIWGAQLETSSSTGPYYATTGTAKTRGTTLADLSGRSNTGALTYGPTYNSADGGAIVFDGSNDCVVVNSNASVLSNTGYTKTVWFYVTSFATNNNLISGGNTGRHVFWLAGGNTLQAGHNSTWNTISSTTSLYSNTWYHAAVTFSTTTGWRLYLNGVLDATNSSTSTVFSAYDVADALFAEVSYGVGYGATTTFLGSGEILIGGYGTGSNGFSGRISNASVYNRVLSATEIQQNYNALAPRFGIISPIVTSGLVLYLDAGNVASYPRSGTTWTDISGSGNTGTLVNGPTFVGNSFNFNGTNQYVSINRPQTITNTGSSTIQCWVNITLNTRGPFLGLGGSTNGFNIGISNGGVFSNTYDTAGSSLILFITFTNIINFGTLSSGGWKMITLVKENASYKMYVNDAQFGTTRNDLAGNTITGSAYISFLNYTTNYYGQNPVGIALMYDRALTVAEIIQNYNSTRGRFGI